MTPSIMNTGIYIHIPFCRRECFYCHFTKRRYEDELARQYVDALEKEIHLRQDPGYIIDTIYIGGGSPSLLDEKQLNTIKDAVYNNFKISQEIEFTIEANPEDLTIEKLKSYRKLGINRVSIGTQSFLPADLEYLRRTHNEKQSLRAVENALHAGFTNINVDFIISLPTQTKQSLETNLNFLRRYPITHVSAYILEDVAEEAENEERDHELYFFTRDKLMELGYDHYEVSNFAKPGRRARHNLKYWHNRDYIGAGLSASGYENRFEYKNTTDFKQYFEKINKHQLPCEELKKLDTPNHNLRKIIMGLRLLDGIPRSHFSGHESSLDFLLENGILQQSPIPRRGNPRGCPPPPGTSIAVNPQKILLLNEILVHFLPPSDVFS